MYYYMKRVKYQPLVVSSPKTIPLQQQDQRLPAKRWLALCGLLVGPVLVNFDATMVNIALSSFQQAMHLSLTLVSWIFHAYNIGLAIGLIPAGRLSDQYGRKRVFFAGLAIFAVGTLWCSLTNSAVLPATSLTPFVFFLGRFVQGLGASALSAAGLAAATAMIAGPRPLIWWGMVSGAAIALVRLSVASSSHGGRGDGSFSSISCSSASVAS